MSIDDRRPHIGHEPIDAPLQFEPVVVRKRFHRDVGEQAVLSVPENRAVESSRTISVPVRRIPAASPAPGAVPLFRLGGGPGLSNLRYAPPPAVGDRRDVILVGYRGVDGSVKLGCPEVTHALRQPHGDVLGATSRARVAQAAAARFARAGVDVAGYTVAEVLADIVEARRVLGYDQIDLLSESYGTRVALLYAQQHPQHVRRSVLIGVNPPGRFVWDPTTVDEQLADWGRIWAARDPSNRHPDLRHTISVALERLPRRWLGLPIDAGKARIVTFVLLFQRRTGLIALDA